MCVPNQSKSPFFINTDSATDVSQSSNTEHIPRLIVMSIIVGRRLIGGRVVEMQNNYREGM